ncbi:MAG: ribosome silencing factor [Desulfuromonadales bacterium]|nr:ribosome silencing factor [Desulfuromonadales bacterium]
MPVKKTETDVPEKLTLSSEERALRCAELAFDKKAYDIRALDISRISSIADFLVIISGSSDKQNQAISDNIRTGLKKFGKVIDIEGAREGKWIVMDYGDVLVHIFQHDLRRYYDLDGLWKMAPLLDLPKAISEAHRESDY